MLHEQSNPGQIFTFVTCKSSPLNTMLHERSNSEQIFEFGADNMPPMDAMLHACRLLEDSRIDMSDIGAVCYISTGQCLALNACIVLTLLLSCEHIYLQIKDQTVTQCCGPH